MNIDSPAAPPLLADPDECEPFMPPKRCQGIEVVLVCRLSPRRMDVGSGFGENQSNDLNASFQRVLQPNRDGLDRNGLVLDIDGPARGIDREQVLLEDALFATDDFIGSSVRTGMTVAVSVGMNGALNLDKAVAPWAREARGKD